MFYTLKYLYEQQRVDPYDFYLKADDDSFIFVDNLREFLRNENSSEPATFGYDFKVIVPKGYHSGGGSYVLTNEALKRIGGLLSSNFSACVNTGTEDVGNNANK
jgi:glycoprotein-N-acetylgalactosamine 3-beta-galactosyltransferase